jgi:hypothetical protein
MSVDGNGLFYECYREAEKVKAATGEQSRITLELEHLNLSRMLR